MSTRVYVVTDRKGGQSRLVRAHNPAQAMRHAAAATFDIGVASQDDLIQLIHTGVEVEDARIEQPALPFGDGAE